MKLNPLTPLGARTPGMHPAFAGVVGFLIAITAACIYLVFANYRGIWPYRMTRDDTKGCYWQQVQCIRAPCPPVWMCPTDDEPLQTTEISVEYRNSDYGLLVVLPMSWDGYSVEDHTWTASKIDDTGREVPATTGIEIHVIPPGSTDTTPLQDIPIMIFTHEQWKHIDGIYNDWVVSPAPFDPRILAENDSYVFALPARYNHTLLENYQEVEDIIESGAIRAF